MTVVMHSARESQEELTEAESERQEGPHTGGLSSWAPYYLGVRLKFGSHLDGLQVFEDGLSFRSPSPLPGGAVIELVLCNGTVLVDARVVQCQPLYDKHGGYAVRVRYHETSASLVELVTRELRDAMEPVGAPATPKHG